MRLATIRTGDGTHAARVEGDALVELDYPDVGALLRSGDDALARAQGDEHVTGRRARARHRRLRARSCSIPARSSAWA